MRTQRFAVIAVLLTAALLLPGPAVPVRAAEHKPLDICGMASPEDLAALYRETLFPTKQEGGCFWSLKPGGMAYFHVELQKSKRELRKYFRNNLSPNTKLVAIKDLGDGGLMNVTEGIIGMVVIRKGDYVLKSAVVFMEIKPESKAQQALWAIYRRILDQVG